MFLLFALLMPPPPTIPCIIFLMNVTNPYSNISKSVAHTRGGVQGVRTPPSPLNFFSIDYNPLYIVHKIIPNKGKCNNNFRSNK